MLGFAIQKTGMAAILLGRNPPITEICRENSRLGREIFFAEAMMALANETTIRFPPWPHENNKNQPCAVVNSQYPSSKHWTLRVWDFSTPDQETDLR